MFHGIFGGSDFPHIIINKCLKDGLYEKGTKGFLSEEAMCDAVAVVLTDISLDKYTDILYKTRGNNKKLIQNMEGMTLMTLRLLGHEI